MGAVGKNKQFSFKPRFKIFKSTGFPSVRREFIAESTRNLN